MLTSALFCLALNIYFEARNQSTLGQLAVAQVVLNRVQNPKYPNSVCGVVTQAEYYPNGKLKKHQCQFSWYCDGKSDNPKDKEAFRWAIYLAANVLLENSPKIVSNSTHYHTIYVSPKWVQYVQRVTRIEDHIFYRIK